MGCCVGAECWRKRPRFITQMETADPGGSFQAMGATRQGTHEDKHVRCLKMELGKLLKVLCETATAGTGHCLPAAITAICSVLRVY